MLCDCHLHTEFSGDSEAPVRAQADRAVSLGMRAVCFTDHDDFDAWSPDGKQEFILDWDAYFRAMPLFREEYEGRLKILTGVELGLQLHIKSYLDERMAQYGDLIDYRIGSSHFVDGIDLYYPDYFKLSPYTDPDELERERYRHYFEATLRRLEACDCYEAVGHLDYVVRYGPNRNRKFTYKDYADVIDPILEVLIRKDKALEVNTGGFKYGLGHPNPHEDIIRRYKELGGKLITVGSDAHAPEHVGFEFARTAEILKSCGFREDAVFEKKKPGLLPVE